MVLFGADGQAWEKCFAALTQGVAADGPVTLVLERPGADSADAEWAPLPVSPRARADAERDGAAAAGLALSEEAVVYGAEEDDAETDGEAAERAARRRDAQLAVETPGSEVSAALGATLLLLVLLLAAGFSP